MTKKERADMERLRDLSRISSLDRDMFHRLAEENAEPLTTERFGEIKAEFEERHDGPPIDLSIWLERHALPRLDRLEIQQEKIGRVVNSLSNQLRASHDIVNALEKTLEA